MKKRLQVLTWPWMSKLSCWLSSSLLAPISLQNSSGSSTPSPHVAVAVTRRLSARLKYGGVSTSGREGQAAHNRTVRNPTGLILARRLFLLCYYYSKLETAHMIIFVSCARAVVVVSGVPAVLPTRMKILFGNESCYKTPTRYSVTPTITRQ